jgi:hypothetical protein
MLDKYFTTLEKYREFEVNDNVQRFEETLGNIARLKDPKSIQKLLHYFDDESDYHDILFGIVHLIEEFDDHTYLQELLPNIPWLVKKSPYWAKVLHYRILNCSSTLDEYTKVSSSLSKEIKLSLKQLLQEIKNEDKEFDARCSELIVKLNP